MVTLAASGRQGGRLPGRGTKAVAKGMLRTADAVAMRSAGRRRGPTGSVLNAVTAASDGSLLWLATGSVLVIVGRQRVRAAAVHATLAVGIASVLVNGPIKLLVRRRRPGRWASAGVPQAGREPKTSSFPSGHTASAFAFAVAGSLEAPQLTVPLGAMATLVGWSRLHTGHHFATDVAGGAAIGSTIAVATHSAFERSRGYRKQSARHRTDRRNQCFPLGILPGRP